MSPITAIADALSMAANAVRNRTEKLELGVIDGDAATIDYDRIGMPRPALAGFRPASRRWVSRAFGAFRSPYRMRYFQSVYKPSELYTAAAPLGRQ